MAKHLQRQLVLQLCMQLGYLVLADAHDRLRLPLGSGRHGGIRLDELRRTRVLPGATRRRGLRLQVLREVKNG